LVDDLLLSLRAHSQYELDDVVAVLAEAELRGHAHRDPEHSGGLSRSVQFQDLLDDAAPVGLLRHELHLFEVYRRTESSTGRMMNSNFSLRIVSKHFSNT
jgi:hypothetical protein